jgi:hypothetical protein
MSDKTRRDVDEQIAKKALDDPEFRKRIESDPKAVLAEMGLPPHEVQRGLMEDERAAPYRDYVSQMEPRCLEVASRIVRNWALRSS